MVLELVVLRTDYLNLVEILNNLERSGKEREINCEETETNFKKNKNKVKAWEAFLD